MKNHPVRQWITAVLTAAALCGLTPAADQPGRPVQPFTFTRVDLELLEQCELLDRQLERRGFVHTDPALEAYLDRVGRAVLPPGPAPERVRWQFRVLRDPYVNAFSMPNGSVYVNTGLLARLENEAQLAGILAHEVTHALKRHGYLKQRSYRRKTMAGHLVQAAAAWVPVGGAVGLGITAIGALAPSLLNASLGGYSRELERESDVFAAARLRAAGYDPGELTGAFQLFEKDFEAAPQKENTREHPALRERVAYLNDLIRRQPPSPEAGAIGRERYLYETQAAARQNIPLDIAAGRFHAAVAVGRKLIEFNPKDSENHRGLGDAYRSLGPRTAGPAAAEQSPAEKKKAEKEKKQMTLSEWEKAMLATPAGQAAWRANQTLADAAYRQALALDPTNGRAHRGLGFLFQKAKNYPEALGQYRLYLKVEPEAPDRLRIERRIAALERITK